MEGMEQRGPAGSAFGLRTNGLGVSHILTP